ncbi:RICIN domain-containing protein [Streptomyces olivoreticuli]|uniref:RICIN domain-containing protein n=1 Tax=Streptomyces olivoreticuli TaxID=68246 RepID=UPI001F079DFF|nr:RICIN domain-containing protein [Streptomyces olivoreticuli]
MDVDNGQTKDGTAIQSWTCAGVPAQQWSYDGAHLKALGKCAAATGPGRGAQVKLATCSNDALQRWTIRDNGELINAAGGKCMEISNGTNSLGTPITTWDCLDVAWHHWNLPRPTGAVVGVNGLCVDVDNGQTKDGTAIQSWTCAGVPAQQWSYDGAHLKALGKCAAATSSNKGAQVKLNTCSNDVLQRWTFRDDGALVNAAGGKCMEISNGTNTLGTPITTWDCLDVAWHHWTLPKAAIATNTIRYGYDGDGLRTSETTAAGTIAYSYDPDGHLTTVRCPPPTATWRSARMTTPVVSLPSVTSRDSLRFPVGRRPSTMQDSRSGSTSPVRVNRPATSTTTTTPPVDLPPSVRPPRRRASART